jgi:hypothetical protein
MVMASHPGARPASVDEGRRPEPTLFAIKAVHSFAFLVELGAILWLVASGLVGRRDRSVAIAGALVAIEAGVFVANDGVCPLTPLAERYGARRGGVSDIFLPDALARTIPIWSSALVATAIALHVRAAIADGAFSRGARTGT